MRPSGPGWLHIVWTLVFNTAIAVVLTLVAWGFSGRADPLKFLMWNFVIAQSIGLTIHALYEAGGHLLGRERIEAFSTPSRVRFSGIPIVGCRSATDGRPCRSDSPIFKALRVLWSRSSSVIIFSTFW